MQDQYLFFNYIYCHKSMDIEGFRYEIMAQCIVKYAIKTQYHFAYSEALESLFSDNFFQILYSNSMLFYSIVGNLL